MVHKELISLRNTIEFFKKNNEILEIQKPVSPIYEISGLQMALENGPALLFNNIEGFPGVRDIANIFARRERVARLFGLDDHKKFKFKILEAMKNPIPPRVVEAAPCQEVIIKDNIDVPATLPLIKHTEYDGGRMLGGGNTFLSGKYFYGGSHLSFNRMSFRGKNWSGVHAFYGTHLGEALMEHRGEKVPATVNIGTPPAVMTIAGGTVMPLIIPKGTDKVGIAGGLQGFPVDIVKAKTVDAYSIAEAEWVIEGYFDTSQRVWETDEAEKLDKYAVAPFFPEWPGYMGRAIKGFKFQATAITHRKDRPIFFTPLAHSYEGDDLCALFREACFFEMANRLIPGFVVDVNILHAITPRAGVVFQIKKRRQGDELYQRNLITAAFGVTQGLYMVIVVDEDIDIYSADDVLWAISTRVNYDKGLMRGTVEGRGSPMLPIERVGLTGKEIAGSTYMGGLGIDATIPYGSEADFQRAKYPADKVDLNKWLSPEEITSVRNQQNDFAKIWAKRGG
ncbi:MAG: UbiD family decarboxylase [Dehalococcoidia bacterium]|nr:UbiD family decarboxylase [Dehalococcoidia bacterium]MDZ4247422.1 UbiD family decarboxylase [Dehalococcoidia bacterium]